jgi:hypothetical protein
MRTSYTSQFDPHTGFWQILSRSGHVVYESDDGEYVQAVCQELCVRYGTGSQLAASSRSLAAV